MQQGPGTAMVVGQPVMGQPVTDPWVDATCRISRDFVFKNSLPPGPFKGCQMVPSPSLRF